MSENTTPAEFDPASEPDMPPGARQNTPIEEYRWYMGGQAMFFASGGIGFVLGQWLIAFYLRKSVV